MTKIMLSNLYDIDIRYNNRSLNERSIEQIYSKVKQSLDLYKIENIKYFEIYPYAINVPDANEMICFHFDSPFWVVYLSERGRRSFPSFFTNWRDAVNFFLISVVGWDNPIPKIDWSDVELG